MSREKWDTRRLDFLKKRQTWNGLFLALVYIFVVAMPLTIATTQMALALAIVIWLGQMLANRRVTVQRTPLDLAFLLLIGAMAISLITAQNRTQALLFSSKRILLIPVVYLIASNVKNKLLLQRLMWLFLIGITVYSATGIVSFLLRPELRVRHIHNSMTAGGITMIGSLLALAMLILARGKNRWLLSGIFAINSVCLLLTNTRGSWLGFLIASFVMIILQKPKIIFAFPVLVLLFYFLVPGAVKERTAHLFDPAYGSNALRLSWWKTGFEIYKDHLITGIGDISTQTIYARYKPQDAVNPIGHFHNNFIHIAVTLGTIGLAAFLFLLTRMFLVLGFIYSRVRKSSSILTIVALAALNIVIAFVINGLFEWNFGDAEIITMVWFMVGAALSFYPLCLSEKVEVSNGESF